MENSLLVISGEIWLMSLYYSTGYLVRFWSNFKKIVKNPILIGISSKLKNNIRTCICIRKNYKNGEFSHSHFWRNLANVPVL